MQGSYGLEGGCNGLALLIMTDGLAAEAAHSSHTT